ncbi:hypothetical protein F383_34868 [Gossypium arboreum]|uniref:Uncharacterized protein n=1 Tax=Gossypium arboreum TaxID=29729 RepID=A0A0B0N5K4_GOSAR|nr:hypothetical protein F383_34868 [Gossypium arboreum]
MQELDQNGNPSDMSLVSYEFLRFKQGSITINICISLRHSYSKYINFSIIYMHFK